MYATATTNATSFPVPISAHLQPSQPSRDNVWNQANVLPEAVLVPVSHVPAPQIDTQQFPQQQWMAKPTVSANVAPISFVNLH